METLQVAYSQNFSVEKGKKEVAQTREEEDGGETGFGLVVLP